MIIGLIGWGFGLLAVFEALEILLGLRRMGRTDACPPTRPSTGRLAVVIPAHNEAAGIAETIRAVQPQLRAGDRLLVVADNCSDDTATRAAEAGARVLERSDETQKGKGFALAVGVEHLAGEEWDWLLALDADCTPSAGALDNLIATAEETGTPVQGLYLMHLPANDEGKGGARWAAFFFALRNWLRMSGLARLGGGVPLLGSGMLFPRAVARSEIFASGHLTEDLELTLRLARADVRTVFALQARIDSYLPQETGSHQTQRQRWSQGRLLLWRVAVFDVVRQLFSRPRLWRFLLLLDMVIPPLALLLPALLLLAGFSSGAAIGLVCLAAALAVAWWRTRAMPFGAPPLSYLPRFAGSAFLVALRALFRPLKQWQRTAR